jgi:hypothetical protein
MQFPLRAKPRHDVPGLRWTLAWADSILTGLGFGSDRVTAIETDDPDLVVTALRSIRRTAMPRSSSRRDPILMVSLPRLSGLTMNSIAHAHFHSAKLQRRAFREARSFRRA